MAGRASLRWIMLAPDTQGQGYGREMMNRVGELAGSSCVTAIKIAASHLSAPFFQRFAA
jgi:GNAT superfamily N-acetyltransferase